MNGYGINGFTGEVIQLTEEDKAFLKKLADDFAAEEAAKQSEQESTQDTGAA